MELGRLLAYVADAEDGRQVAGWPSDPYYREVYHQALKEGLIERLDNPDAEWPMYVHRLTELGRGRLATAGLQGSRPETPG